MKLKEIIENLSGVRKIEGNTSLEIRGLSCDSKRVIPEYLFVAVKGSCFNGADFINEAIDRGAHAVVLESSDNKGFAFRRGITFIYVNNARRALSEASRTFYGDISSEINLIGVTGTNGKTTITYLLESLFKIRFEETGLIGSINYRFGNRLIPATNTTPGVLDLYSLLSSMKKENIKNCILEVSSHSLEQGRVDTLQFDIGIFTNLTPEHLDYHKRMEDYLSSKIKLFTKIKKAGYAIINKDDPSSEKIIERVGLEKDINIITYGIESEVDVSAKDIKFSFEDLRFKLFLRKGYSLSGGAEEAPLERDFIEIESRLIGRHNVYNILAGASCGIAMGMTLEEIVSGIKNVTTLPGRLERIDCSQDFLVFVDYAHTEDGLENALKTLKALEPKRLFCVFGCGGDRDKTKRPKMGRVSSELSDKIFITTDNPRNEEPMDIIREITEGICKGKDSYVIEVDRFKAISRALKEAKKGDIVLVAGKGHETYQIFKNITLPFDDREVVRRILNTMLKVEIG